MSPVDVFMAMSRVGMIDRQRNSLDGARKGSLNETRKETNHMHGKERRDSSRLREQLRSPKKVEIAFHMLEYGIEESSRR